MKTPNASNRLPIETHAPNGKPTGLVVIEYGAAAAADRIAHPYLIRHAPGPMLATSNVRRVLTKGTTVGKSLDQILAVVGDGDTLGVTLATNQDSGIVAYATGLLTYRAAHVEPVNHHATLASLGTVADKPLAAYFSDRRLDIDPAGAGFGHLARQLFSANALDKLGVSISLIGTPRVLALTFISWGGTTARIALEARGNLLMGLGPSLGNSAQALYVLSFQGITGRPA